MLRRRAGRFIETFGSGIREYQKSVTGPCYTYWFPKVRFGLGEGGWAGGALHSYPSVSRFLCPALFATSPSSLTSTTAKPRSSTNCSASPAPSAKTSRSLNA
ncbi:hypothetical protein BCAR13_1030005 [Paraburkholderia caribensis]|nr:hypothetical protein BCAR13_1030005 [Paraburkholderia caribensis]